MIIYVFIILKSLYLAKIVQWIYLIRLIVKNYKFHVHQSQAQIEIHLTFTWFSPDHHLTFPWPLQDPYLPYIRF